MVLRVLVLLRIRSIAGAGTEVTAEVAEDAGQECRGQSGGAAAFVFDGVPDQVGRRFHICLVKDQRTGAARHLPVPRHVRVGKADHVGETAAELGAELAFEPGLEGVLRTLGLRYRALDRVSAGPVGLVPLPVFDADLAAFYFDRRHPDAGPQHQQVDLVLGPAIPDMDGMGQHAVLRQAAPQRFPCDLFRQLAVAEFRLLRNAPHCCPHPGARIPGAIMRLSYGRALPFQRREHTARRESATARRRTAAQQCDVHHDCRRRTAAEQAVRLHPLGHAPLGHVPHAPDHELEQRTDIDVVDEEYL